MRRRLPQGFTLVEIIVVLALGALLALIAVPNVVSLLSRYRLSGATRQVMGDLMWARMQAVTQKNEFKVVILDEYRYRILDDDDNDGTTGPGERIWVTDLRKNYPGVVIGHTADPVFFPGGSAAMGTITLANQSGSKKLKIHITGRVKSV